ncbi:hypothetical protein LTR50_007746 [Elasticomyces elasticus]|nr:hypothetical protein LTR50_007746 [Elasticomyces elasticus]
MNPTANINEKIAGIFSTLVEPICNEVTAEFELWSKKRAECDIPEAQPLWEKGIDHCFDQGQKRMLKSWENLKNETKEAIKNLPKDARPLASDLLAIALDRVLQALQDATKSLAIAFHAIVNLGRASWTILCGALQAFKTAIATAKSTIVQARVFKPNAVLQIAMRQL